VVHAGIEALPRQGHEVNEIQLDPEVLTRAGHDYIALGHLHRHQVPQVNAAFAGSLERLDFGDVEGEKAVLEVDLEQGAGKPGFIKRHQVSARPVFDFSIACGDLDLNAVFEAIETEADGVALADALVRVRLEGIARDVYQSLDLDGIGELFEGCFHYQLAV